MPSPNLRAVSEVLPDPPYSAETQAGAFSLDLEVHRLMQSDTWGILSADARPWWVLLMVVSWAQTPCASLPNDNRLLAGKLGCTAKFFEVHREDMLRGWRLHSDGRLYHHVLTHKVLGFLSERRKAAERQRRFYDKKKQGDKENLTRSSRVTNAQVGVTNAPSSSSSSSPSSKDCVTSCNARESSKKDAPPAKRCPYAKIRDLWIEILPNLPAPLEIEHWTANRKKLVRDRWQDQLPELEDWQRTFEFIRQSKFLMGRVTPRNGHKQFQATLEWIAKPANLLKLYEGQYDG